MVLMDDDGEALAQAAGEQVGEGDKDGETGPWREGLLWDCHNRDLRGRATLLPTGPALGVLESGGSIPRSTRERSQLGWTPPLAWARDARTHTCARGTEAAEWWCVGTCGVSERGFVANCGHVALSMHCVADLVLVGGASKTCFPESDSHQTGPLAGPDPGRGSWPSVLSALGVTWERAAGCLGPARLLLQPGRWGRIQAH